MPRVFDRLGWAIAGAACLAFVAVAANLVGAGPLDPPGPPGSTMKSLDVVEPRHPIFAVPYNVAVPGSYYLTDNLYGGVGQTGITVSVSDVTIDLNGFALTGGAGSQNGIAVAAGTKTVNIRNGTVRGWGGRGVAAGGVADSLFESLSLVGNGQYGIVVGGDTADATNNILRDCVASSNGIGVQFGGGGIVENCSARNNDDGFVINGSNTTLRNSSASGNHLPGATVSGVLSRIEGNNFTGNNTNNDGTFGAGLRVTGTSNLIISNSASGNLQFDFKVGVSNTLGTLQGPAAPTLPWANIIY
jgi:parallel beta-helix repeat protein